jgi:hypothetical protein
MRLELQLQGQPLRQMVLKVPQRNYSLSCGCLEHVQQWRQLNWRFRRAELPKHGVIFLMGQLSRPGVKSEGSQCIKPYSHQRILHNPARGINVRCRAIQCDFAVGLSNEYGCH